MITEILAADPAALHHSFGATVDFLAQTRNGGSGGSGGSGFEGLAATVKNLAAIVAGLFCVVKGAIAGSKEKSGREALNAGAWWVGGGVVVSVLIWNIDNIIGLANSLFSGVV